MSWYACYLCGKDVEILGFNAMGCRIMCESCHEAEEAEVNQAWQQTLKRANEN